MRRKTVTLGQLFGDAFAKLKEDLGTGANPGEQNGRPRLELPSASDQARGPKSWRDSSKAVPTQKRRGASKGSSVSHHGVAKSKGPKPESYPGLPDDARERAKRLAREQANKIANDRAHVVALEQSKREASDAGRRRKYNEVFATTRDEVANNAYTWIYEQRCKDEFERSRKGLRTYVEVRGTSAPAPKSRQVACVPELQPEQLSADMSKVRIVGSLAEAVAGAPPPSVAESLTAQSQLAILGLDFGTAFTKAVVGWGQKRFAVDWSGAVKLDEPYLLPSVFSESADGSAVLGVRAVPGWTTRSGLKMQILEVGDPSGEVLVDAVIFVALAFRQAVDSFSQRHKMAVPGDLRWRLHLGIPAKAWDDTAITDTFRVLAEAAMRVALSKAAVSRAAAIDALANQGGSELASRVSVMPEFACQLYSYLRSTQRQPDLHALVDVGAGTLDVVFFNVHDADDSDVLPIFSAAVANLGAHHLIGACAGRAGEGLEWKDRDSSKSTNEFALLTGEQEPVVEFRRQAYLNKLAGVIRDAYNEARGKYPASSIFLGGSPLELFLCGGGKGVDVIAKRIRKVANDAASVYGVKIVVLPLPQPDDLEDYDDTAFDRMSVAYGLSQLQANVGEVRRRQMVDQYEANVTASVEDRDATR